MKPFIRLTSQVIPLPINDVDTDMIIPAQFLTKVDKEGYGQHLFYHLKQDEKFIFNDPSYQNAKILLTQDNFGCGSSREHAVWSIKQAGIDVVIAESFSDIFYNNAAKNGLLLIMLEHDTIAQLMQQTQHNEMVMTVDLERQTINANGENFHFDYDPFRKTCLLKGQDDLDYLLEMTSA